MAFQGKFCYIICYEMGFRDISLCFFRLEIKFEL